MRLSDELKNGQDNIMCASYDEVGLRDALQYLFTEGIPIANLNEMELSDIGISRSLNYKS